MLRMAASLEFGEPKTIMISILTLMSMSCSWSKDSLGVEPYGIHCCVASKDSLNVRDDASESIWRFTAVALYDTQAAHSHCIAYVTNHASMALSDILGV